MTLSVGDVTNNATPNLLSAETRDFVGKMIFTTQSKFVKKGDKVRLVFETNNEIEIEAWQFSLSFEPSLLEYSNVEKIENIYFGTSVLEKGAITFSWNKKRILI